MKKYLLLSLFLLSQTLYAQLSVSKLFQDHAVLQRDAELTVWGWASAKDQIKVSLAGVTRQAKTDTNGKWKAVFPAQPAGGPHQLQIADKTETISVTDLYFGDVWLCSGQSNMEWPVSASMNAEKEIQQGNDPLLRHYYVPHVGSFALQDTLPPGEWSICTPETTGRFTAVGYYFARQIRETAGVPIGLLHSSWGGSRIEAWMSAESLGYTNVAAAEQAHDEAVGEKERVIKAKMKAKYGSLTEKDQGMKDDQPLWTGLKMNDTDWKEIKVPGLWENADMDGFDGVVWFRKTIDLPEKATQMDATLRLAMIDDSDITWVNGTQVGTMSMQWNKQREYTVPATVLRPGKNVITVRVEDTGGGGGFHGEATDMSLESGDFNISLAGKWKCRPSAVYSQEVVPVRNTPTKLYNHMIHPVLDFPIKGVLWYQGESNAWGDDAIQYREQFQTMITDWRNRWGIGDFPFLFVQLANFMAPKPTPDDSQWAVLRESQSAALALPNTGQAVIIDIGEADDIHPRNKQDVGKRLALAGRHIAYGEEIVYSGPVYRSMVTDGNQLILSFNHVGSGLVCKDKYGYLKGFAIAGADGVYHWAKARIEKDKVVVWSEKVAQPKSVRYGWADNPDDANFYNEEGLPACPFRAGE